MAGLEVIVKKGEQSGYKTWCGMIAEGVSKRRTGE